MATLEFEIANQRELDQWFDTFKRELGDLSEVWPDVVQEFYKIEEEHFNSEGHGKWQPLSPAYTKWKAAHAPGRPLLVLENRLRAAATGGSGSVVVKEPERLLIGFKGVPYWRYHQNGTSRMPARRVVDFDNNDRARLRGVFREAVIAQLRRKL